MGGPPPRRRAPGQCISGHSGHAMLEVASGRTHRRALVAVTLGWLPPPSAFACPQQHEPVLDSAAALRSSLGGLASTLTCSLPCPRSVGKEGRHGSGSGSGGQHHVPHQQTHGRHGCRPPPCWSRSFITSLRRKTISSPSISPHAKASSPRKPPFAIRTAAQRAMAKRQSGHAGVRYRPCRPSGDPSGQAQAGAATRPRALVGDT